MCPQHEQAGAYAADAYARVTGGLGWYQTLALFESVAKQRKIIGFDVMEFAPIAGFHAFDFTAALLTYKLMGIVQRTAPLPSQQTKR